MSEPIKVTYDYYGIDSRNFLNLNAFFDFIKEYGSDNYY